MQQVWLEAQKGDDLRSHARAHSPPTPVIEVGFEFQMDKSVAQRSRHREVYAPLGSRIAGGDDHPAVRQHILSQLAVENQLVAAGLRHLRSRCQLIEKENALALGRQELGWNPFGLVCGDTRQSPKIDRIELDGTNVKKLKVKIGSDLRHDLRFTDAARAPDMQRHTFADQRMKRFVKLGWFHLGLPQADYWFGCEEWPVGHLFGNALGCRAGRFGVGQRRRYKLIPE